MRRRAVDLRNRLLVASLESTFLQADPQVNWTTATTASSSQQWRSFADSGVVLYGSTWAQSLIGERVVREIKRTFDAPRRADHARVHSLADVQCTRGNSWRNTLDQTFFRSDPTVAFHSIPGSIAEKTVSRYG